MIFASLSGCARDRGEFSLQLQPATQERNQQIKKLLEKAGFEKLVEGLNRSFILPQHIDLTFREGDEGAFYQQSKVVICYDFLADIKEALQASEFELSPAAQDGIVLANAHFILYHELGHALIDVLDLPVVGREEDAVDGLATVIAVCLLKKPQLAVAAAVALDVADDPERQFEQNDFWDVHSLNAQRYYNILCWVHGSGPEECEKLVGGLVPDDWFQDRAEDCDVEFDKLARNWSRLLEPHLKPGIRLLVKAGRRAHERQQR